MSKKPAFKEALQALKPNEPYRRANEKVKEAIQFRAPKKSEPILNSDQTDLSANWAEFDFIHFAPKGMKLDLVEKDGEFHIPHRLFEFIHKALSTKVEILVFSCLLRNTLGYRKHQCQISQTFIGRWTGIASPNVRRALRQLEDSGLIVLKAKGESHHESAVYEIPLVKAFLKKKNDKKSISDQTNLSSQNTENGDQNNLTSEINLIPNKERINKSKKTLSHFSFTHEDLSKYFSQALPEKRRESDLNTFFQLQKIASEEKIGCALKLVLNEGMIGTGELPHSPWNYLAHAFPEVLEVIEKRKQISAETEKKRIAAEAEMQAKAEQARQEQEESEKKERAFKKVFPSEVEQAQVIQKFCKELGFPLNPSSTPAKFMAISSWWDELAENNRMQLLGAV